MDNKEIALRLLELAHNKNPDGNPEEYLKTLVRLWERTLSGLESPSWRGYRVSQILEDDVNPGTA